ncbi:hypothetical protein E2C01_056321 [Portunus trituberculatus]|uniref:Uncharacterized protein n=1 Tax=Portunus trituberculatus TaxID=210409 RepID=A0A5B7GZA6_PORTR|nr:hypothetical protein [Portunus trituberculatus]
MVPLYHGFGTHDHYCLALRDFVTVQRVLGT